MTILLARWTGDPLRFLAVQVPDWATAIELAAVYTLTMPAEWVAASEWCCVEAEESRVARWPKPEPWA